MLGVYWESDARRNFEHAIQGVEILIEQHDDLSGPGPGRPGRRLEVLKQSALILAVTAWETYIEDTLRSEVRARIAAASEPAAVLSTFNSVAAAHLEALGKNPTELVRWTGDGWRDVILGHMESEVSALNTPRGENIQKLSQRYLGMDLTDGWRWRQTSPEDARDRLDELITLRGELVHRSSEFFDMRQRVRKSDVLDGVKLLRKLVQCTDHVLGIDPKTFPAAAGGA